MREGGQAEGSARLLPSALFLLAMWRGAHLRPPPHPPFAPRLAEDFKVAEAEATVVLDTKEEPARLP